MQVTLFAFAFAKCTLHNVPSFIVFFCIAPTHQFESHWTTTFD